MKDTNELDLLSKLASKAKKKLSKVTDAEELKTIKAIYEFKQSDMPEQEKKLQKKIVQLVENNPDCDDPIGRLIDHKIYDNLNEERKQAYIFKLASDYREICNRLHS